MGYYLLALAAPEAILLVAGLERLMPERWRLLPVLALAAMFSLIDLYGTGFLLLPYYGGAIGHDGGGGLPALGVAQAAQGGGMGLVERLASMGPWFVSARGIEVMTALWCAAAVGLVVAAGGLAAGEASRERRVGSAAASV